MSGSHESSASSTIGLLKFALALGVPIDVKSSLNTSLQ
jgi:hypothetical protein